MLIQPFKVSPFNQHHQGEYSDRDIEWRRVCAIDKVSNILALLGGQQVQSVLEVGCGTGAVLAEVRQRGIGTNHQGIDIAAPGEHTDANAKNLSLAEYDGQNIPFADGAFDFVYASHVVEHVTNPRAFVLEIARVSRRLVYLEVPCELHFRTTHSEIQNSLDIGHINSYTPESFCLLAQTSGLKIIDMGLFDHSVEVHQFHTSPIRGRIKMKLRRSLLSMNPVLASRIFTYHCGILCSPMSN
jgi:SAM-dependent methyltransferase